MISSKLKEGILRIAKMILNIEKPFLRYLLLGIFLIFFVGIIILAYLLIVILVEEVIIPSLVITIEIISPIGAGVIIFVIIVIWLGWLTEHVFKNNLNIEKNDKPQHKQQDKKSNKK